MGRHVAHVYFNASAAFTSCATQAANGPLCLPLPPRPADGSAGLPKGAPPSGKGVVGTFGRRGRKRLLLQGPPGRPQVPSAYPLHSPYWATPQCVLTRHMLAALPNLEVVPCAAQSMPIRLERPRR